MDVGLVVGVKILVAVAVWLGLVLGAAMPARAETYFLPENGDSVVGNLRYTFSRADDTLAEVARREGIGLLNLIAANPGVDPLLPGQGTRIVLPTQIVLPPGPRTGVVVNLAELRVFYYLPDLGQVLIYPIGIGRLGWSTPLGTTRITQKVANPTWTPPQSIRDEHAARGDILPPVIPAGPDNPLGLFALRLGFTTGAYLIHGTNKAYGVGMRVSHGCIRLYPDHIEHLFSLVRPGTAVRVMNQAYKLGVRGGEYYLEAHEPLTEDRRDTSIDPEAELMKLLADQGYPDAISMARALEELDAELGLPVRISAPRSGGRVELDQLF